MMSQRPPPPDHGAAIVGIGCRFPGGVTDAASFWQLLIEGRDAIGEIPQDRIDVARYFDSQPARPGRMMTRWGGFLGRLDDFDAAFFGMSPREAECVDPQQRLLLETSWEALEDAGIDATRLAGSSTGVFVGQWLSDFESRLFGDPAGVDFEMTTGSGRYASSGRLSYCLGLRGPSLTVDTACSSSLVAVQLALRSLREGECTLALAAGANVILQPQISIAYSQSRMMAPDGRCKFGDASGDGYVRSEGVGVVALKPLGLALRDGDRIYAVVRGAAVNNDGRSSGSMGTPSRVGQEELLRTAYRDAGVSPSRVGYVEAHGTGTRAGDPVELGALGTVLAEGRAPGDVFRVGSVKTNIGHTEGAAGIAGLIKATLALHHGVVPASLHCRVPNPAIAWADLPLELAREARAWPANGLTPRVTGVSAFGIAGTNAHIVLEEAPAPHAHDSAPQATLPLLLPLSARSTEALRALALRYAERIVGDPAVSAEALCWSAATRRAGLDVRATFVANDRDTLIAQLRGFAAGDDATPIGDVGVAPTPRIAFVCPGQGGQWLGMARDLLADEPTFRDALQACDAAARPWIGVSIVECLEASDVAATTALLERIDVVQPVLVALAIAYAALWRGRGIEPTAVVGHSMGEVAAACIAGAIRIEDAMRIVCGRSALMRTTSGHGAMAVVELPAAELERRLQSEGRSLVVAADNSPRSSVVAGTPEAVDEFLATLAQEGVFCRRVNVDVASHSPQMAPLAARLSSLLEPLVARDAPLPIYSTVLGGRTDASFDATYWARNLREPVQFGPAVQRMLEDGVSIFIELGPHPVLLPSIAQTAQAARRTVATVACGYREHPSAKRDWIEGVGALWRAGVTIDWTQLLPRQGVVDLPLYPWQRERHWSPAAERRDDRGAVLPIRPSSLDATVLDGLHASRWRRLDPPEPASGAAGRWWLVGGNGDVAAWAAALGPHVAQAEPVAMSELARRLAGCPAEDEVPDGIVAIAPPGIDAPYFPLQTLQALPAATGGPLPRVWFVTTGAQAVRDGERVDVAQAALWGAARVVAEEQPHRVGGLVDVDPSATPAAQAGALLRQLRAMDCEEQVALRNGARHVLRLEPTTRDPAAPFAWRRDATYLVTGGLGDIGLHLARAMVEAGACRLVLLGRTQLPPRAQWAGISDEPTRRRIEAIRALEARGASVHVAGVDVGDEAQLRDFLQRFEAEAWPPIRGVVHAAGVFANQLAGQMDRATFDTALRGKLGGAQWLDRLLPELDLFVLCSSAAALLPQAGQANYAAANAGLDALALDRRARGLPALSIAWGVWRDTGLVADAAGARNVGEMERQGLRSLTAEQGTALFGWLCGRSQPLVAVMPADWNAWRRARAGRDVAWIAELAASAGSTAESRDMAQLLLDADLPERRRLLETIVRDSVGQVLKLAPARIDARKAFGAMGLNSLMALELRNRLEAALQRPLSATLAWNYPTVEALVAHLSSDAAAPTLPSAQRAESQPAATHRVQAFAELTDEDAALALRAPRRGNPARRTA